MTDFDFSFVCLFFFAYTQFSLITRILTIQGNLDAVINVLQNVLPSLEEVLSLGFRNFQRKQLIFQLKVSKIRGERTGRVGDSDARLLVHQSQIGCIIGRGGAKVKELREVLSISALLPPLLFLFRSWCCDAQLLTSIVLLSRELTGLTNSSGVHKNSGRDRCARQVVLIVYYSFFFTLLSSGCYLCPYGAAPYCELDRIRFQQFQIYFIPHLRVVVF